jgi:hypothetical protein
MSAILPVASQSLDEFRKERESAFEAFRQAQAEQSLRMQKEYDLWVRQQDEEFRKYLEQRWRDFEKFRSQVHPLDDPKPGTIPEYNPLSEKGPEVLVEQVLDRSSPFPDIQGTDFHLSLPPVRKSEDTIQHPLNVSFTFYGRAISLLTDSSLLIPVSGDVSEKAIAAYWGTASEANYSGLVGTLIGLKEEMGLNDYGYFLLVQDLAESVYSSNSPGQVLLTWHVMNRSGYEVKVGRQGSSLLLLLPSPNYLYGKDYITMDGMRYWVMGNAGEGTIAAYERNTTPGGSLVRFSIPRAMSITGRTLVRPITVKIGGYNLNLNLKYDPGLVDFFRDYPVVDMEVYFNASLSQPAKESLIEGLRPVVAGMTGYEAANFLLRFVQTGFQYATDQEQFGKEKPMFCEEILFYPFSDCEDRSVIFAQLVRELLGIDVVGLVYSNHMATAVRLSPEDGEGQIEINGSRYTIADPTYIGAPLGELLPSVREERPSDVITRDPIGGWKEKQTAIWQSANDIGIHAAGVDQNILALPGGESFVVVGYQDEELHSGSSAYDDIYERKAVAACFDLAGNLLWKRLIPAGLSSCGISIINSDGADFYLAGVYSEQRKIAGEENTRQAKEGVFVARLTSNGDILWKASANFDTSLYRSDLPFTFECREGGSEATLSQSPYYADFNQYGFSRSNSGRLFFTGITSLKTTLVARAPVPLEQQAHFNLAELIKRVNDEFIRANTDPGIAGIFATTEIVKEHHIEIKGSDIQSALDKYNPTFRARNKELYQALGDIVFVKNNKGMINIRTRDGNRVLIYKMKIRDNSSLSISPMKNGDLLIEVLEGIDVGGGIRWANLTRIKLLRKSGDIVFEYIWQTVVEGQERYNMRRDILN